MAWAPILTGGERDATRDVVVELGAALAAHPVAPDALDPLGDAAIASAYLAADGTRMDPADPIAGSLAAMAARLAAGGFGPSLFGGAAHVGWTLAHLADDDDADAACTAIEESLVRRLDTWDGDYDLLSGVVGLGVYALERCDPGRPLALRVLDHLERRATPRAGGLAWHTAAALLPPEDREVTPDGYWNLGVAHGAPGVIGLLARYVAAGIAAERSRTLLDGAVAYVTAAATPGGGGRYAAWQAGGPMSEPMSGPVPRRLAWCYGDLGVAMTVLGAGILVDEPGWRAAGLELARDCAGRSVEHAAIRDARLCHGASGIAHLFNRMAQATGDVVLADAARAWILRAAAMRGLGDIAGGTLLSGAPGLVLALHAAISDVEPAWDRLLLADLPPR